MILFSVLLLAAAETAAVPMISASPVEATVPAPAKRKKICRVEDGGDPSSHFQKRTCLTAEQWEQRARAASNTQGSGLSAAGSSND